MKKFNLSPYYDPYDLWAIPFSQNVRQGFYQGNTSSKLIAAGIAITELLCPSLARNAMGIKKSLHPITVAQYILLSAQNRWISNENSKDYVNLLRQQSAIDEVDCLAFGLGFVWVSKNGTYSKNLPFITHTPYAMEALLSIMAIESGDSAEQLFKNTWRFIESLIVMEESHDILALSYAPVEEPRIVINANSYAALSYSLHLVNNPDCDKNVAFEKSVKIVNWILSQQQDDGSWLYYADQEPGNFIDCFHSCFIVKNLLKIKENLSLNDAKIDNAIEKGTKYIIENFYDPTSGLVSRFSVRDIKDPYKYILYDQAEFIGILLDTGNIDLASKVIEGSEIQFKKNNSYYAQIDILGRKVGKDYMRWGIIPYLFQKSRFDFMRASSCAE
ncbi:prenyltransferase/squalene oxidase repeat-containing protein [Enterovibrio calviensis]|uniref:hypothetical protein n=1 Tax=Enterovibrio calviensis TaxID=91359 RepID=UPI0004809A91|nr:hypothetical protein [Enterovibrio calviensis]